MRTQTERKQICRACWDQQSPICETCPDKRVYEPRLVQDFDGKWIKRVEPFCAVITWGAWEQCRGVQAMEPRI